MPYEILRLVSLAQDEKTVSDVVTSAALREEARSDENNAFMSEDSIGIRRANKGVEKRKI